VSAVPPDAGIPPPPGPPARSPRSPAPAAPRRLVLGAVASGLLASLLIPGEPPGLGSFLVAVALAASVAATRPRRITREVVVVSSLGLALAAMPLLRSAPWLLALDALAALGLASLAVVGGSTWTQVIRAPVSVLTRLPQAPPFLWRGLRGPRGRVRRPSPVLRGAAIGGALLTVFGGLFLTADRAFAHLASEILIPEWDFSLLPARMIVFGLVAVTVGGYAAANPRFAHLWGSPPGLWAAVARDERRAPRRLGRTEWIVALTLLDLLFLAFVALQIAVLFGGHTHVLETAGLTYAEYAREGFFQLLLVGALTLAVVAGAVRWAARARRRDTVVLRALLGLLCGLTLVVLASALRRLGLYEEAFGFTRARLSAHAILLWLAGVLLLVMVAGIRMRAWWLPRTVVAFTAVSLLAFSVANPDGLVAAKNVERFRETGWIDLGYLAGLSPDAVPALATLPPRLRGCVLLASGGIADRLAVEESWHAWSLARARARSVVAAFRGVDADLPTCPGEVAT
jgi:hypothetical protein